jgi:uncharacterized tellurite resistance protein B-like protein
MFESFRNFVAEFVEGERHPSQFADNNYRVAAVALLVHAAAIDGEVSPSERAKLHSVVKRRFELDEATADELIDKATTAETRLSTSTISPVCSIAPSMNPAAPALSR